VELYFTPPYLVKLRET